MLETLPSHVCRAIDGDPTAEGRIFAQLLESTLPESEKTLDRLSMEAFSLTGAGTETTAVGAISCDFLYQMFQYHLQYTPTVIVFHLLTQPAVRARLEKELLNAGSEPAQLDWNALEQLPYLYAVIHKGLRLSYGVSARLPRIVRCENLIYRSKDGEGCIIPQGTPIGMSSAMMHHNESIFPNSFEYRPERWLDENGKKNHALEKYLFTFSKGSRRCSGMNLALCELYLVVAACTLHVLPRMRLEPETTVDNVTYGFDLMLARPQKAGGVQVRISSSSMTIFMSGAMKRILGVLAHFDV